MAVWHLGSLDAPTVAVVWSFAIARSAGVRLELWIPLLLACVTWTAYVLDRLLDARHAIRTHNLALLRERHYFHWHHRRALLPLAAATGAIATILIFRLMPIATREHDSIIAVAALAYFSGVHGAPERPHWARRIFSKELLVGILFTAGCAAPALSRMHTAASTWPTVLNLTLFALLAWLNCAAIESWESQIAQICIPATALLLAFAGLTLAIILSPFPSSASSLLICGSLSALFLLALHHVRNRLNPVTLRALADLVLLTPAIQLFLGALHT